MQSNYKFNTGDPIVDITTMRVASDEYLKVIDTIPKTRYSSLAYTELEKGRMWMGRLLGLLGKETPYPNDGERKRVEDIEPPADVSKGCGCEWKKMDVIVRVDTLREVLDTLVDFMAAIPPQPIDPMPFEIVKKYVLNSRMYLGMVLKEIREVNLGLEDAYNTLKSEGVKGNDSVTKAVKETKGITSGDNLVNPDMAKRLKGE